MPLTIKLLAVFVTQKKEKGVALNKQKLSIGINFSSHQSHWRNVWI